MNSYLKRFFAYSLSLGTLVVSVAVRGQDTVNRENALQILRKVETSMKLITTLEYTGQRTIISHGQDDSVHIVSGTVWWSVLPSDTIFGSRFHIHGQDRRDLFDYFYDGQRAYEFRHQSKTQCVVKPSLFDNTPNNPAKARTAVGVLHPLFTDTEILRRAFTHHPAISMRKAHDNYLIALTYPLNKAGSVLEQWITVNRNNYFVTAVKNIITWNGTVQTQLFSASYIRMNDSCTLEKTNMSPMGEGYQVEDLTHATARSVAPISELVGKTAKDFQYSSFAGDNIQLSAYRGRYVLLNFWETWCGYCILNLPRVQRLHYEYSTKGLAVIGVTAENRKQVANLITRNHLTYPTLLADSRILYAYQVKSRPIYVLIDPAGMIIQHSSGDLDSIIQEVKSHIE